MRRLRLGDVVESGRRIGSSTRPMAAGTGCRAVAQGVADAPVPTAQTAELTVHGTLDGTSPRQSPVGSLACRISSTDSVWNAGRAPATTSTRRRAATTSPSPATRRLRRPAARARLRRSHAILEAPAAGRGLNDDPPLRREGPSCPVRDHQRRGAGLQGNHPRRPVARAVHADGPPEGGNRRGRPFLGVRARRRAGRRDGDPGPRRGGAHPPRLREDREAEPRYRWVAARAPREHDEKADPDRHLGRRDLGRAVLREARLPESVAGGGGPPSAKILEHSGEADRDFAITNSLCVKRVRVTHRVNTTENHAGPESRPKVAPGRRLPTLTPGDLFPSVLAAWHQSLPLGAQSGTSA